MAELGSELPGNLPLAARQRGVDLVLAGLTADGIPDCLHRRVSRGEAGSPVDVTDNNPVPGLGFAQHHIPADGCGLGSFCCRRPIFSAGELRRTSARH